MFCVLDIHDDTKGRKRTNHPFTYLQTYSAVSRCMLVVVGRGSYLAGKKCTPFAVVIITHTASSAVWWTGSYYLGILLWHVHIIDKQWLTIGKEVDLVHLAVLMAFTQFRLGTNPGDLAADLGLFIKISSSKRRRGTLSLHRQTALYH